MSIRKFVVLVSIVCLSTVAYAQKGLGKAVEAAVQRQVVVPRAKVPTLRDGVRNLVTRRLGNVTAVAGMPEMVASLSIPTSSVLHFGQALQAPQMRMAELPRNEGKSRSERAGDFYDAAKPGSGNIKAIALPAHVLIQQAVTAEAIALEEQSPFLRLATELDAGFFMSKEGNLEMMPWFSAKQVSRPIKNFKQGAKLSPGVEAVWDAFEIQAWMLEHKGRFPTTGEEGEASLVQRFDAWIDKVANDPEYARNPGVQGIVQHLVHLKTAATGTMSPFKVIYKVLERVDQAGRIPGSSLVGVSPEEDALTKELNYVEQLRRANLLHLVVPMEKDQHVVELYLNEFQQRGYIYQQMIKIIPEFASDGVTLNVPAHSQAHWQILLEQWKAKRTAAGLSQTPRTAIKGRLGLPINFNDLTPEEKTEVLLGTYLRVTHK